MSSGHGVAARGGSAGGGGSIVDAAVVGVTVATGDAVRFEGGPGLGFGLGVCVGVEEHAIDEARQAIVQSGAAILGGMGRWCWLSLWLACQPNGTHAASPLPDLPGPKGPLDEYPASTRFCGEHVSGVEPDGTPGAHIIWNAFATPELTVRVVDHYLAALGEGGHERMPDGDLWRDPPREPDKVLSVHAFGHEGPWTTARCAAPEGTNTVVVIATIARPRR
jgi:hypothetical protein